MRGFLPTIPVPPRRRADLPVFAAVSSGKWELGMAVNVWEQGINGRHVMSVLIDWPPAAQLEELCRHSHFLIAERTGRFLGETRLKGTLHWM